MFFLLKHSVIEGFKNLGRSFWLAVTAIFVIMVSFTMVVGIAGIWVTVGYLLRQFDNQAVLYVYIKDDVDQEFIDIMQSDLQSLPEVQSLTYIDKAAARDLLLENPFFSSTLRDLIESGVDEDQTFFDNLVQESFEIVPTSSETYLTVELAVNDEKYTEIVAQIQGTRELIETLQVVYRAVSITGFIMVIIFGMLSILVMANMIRIAIYSRRSEIEIMRLVGATNAYIRGPFIAEGILYNMIAATVVCLIFLPLFNIMAPFLENYFSVTSGANSANLLNQTYLAIAGTILVGIGAGSVTSFFTTQKYLKL